jgi:hypothetical protein
MHALLTEEVEKNQKQILRSSFQAVRIACPSFGVFLVLLLSGRPTSLIFEPAWILVEHAVCSTLWKAYAQSGRFLESKVSGATDIRLVTEAKRQVNVVDCHIPKGLLTQSLQLLLQIASNLIPGRFWKPSTICTDFAFQPSDLSHGRFRQGFQVLERGPLIGTKFDAICNTLLNSICDERHMPDRIPGERMCPPSNFCGLTGSLFTTFPTADL